MFLCRAGYQTGNWKTRAAAELVLEQQFFEVVAACHNFLIRVSLDQVFGFFEGHMTISDKKYRIQIQEFLFQSSPQKYCDA